ncbi:MAG: hypothetical protein ACYT04_42770, partial [Nostoc sp.]
FIIGLSFWLVIHAALHERAITCNWWLKVRFIHVPHAIAHAKPQPRNSNRQHWLLKVFQSLPFKL